MKHPKSATETWLICSILDAHFEGMWQRVAAGTWRLQRFSKFPRFTDFCSGAFLQLLRNQKFQPFIMPMYARHER